MVTPKQSYWSKEKWSQSMWVRNYEMRWFSFLIWLVFFYSHSQVLFTNYLSFIFRYNFIFYSFRFILCILILDIFSIERINKNKYISNVNSDHDVDTCHLIDEHCISSNNGLILSYHKTSSQNSKIISKYFILK
jgi:hypothetical protein